MSDTASIALSCPNETIIFFIGLGVGLLSFVVHRIIDYFKVNREDFNKEIEKAGSLVSDLIEDGCAYWSANHKDENSLQEQKIKTTVHRLSIYTVDLYKINNKFDQNKAEKKLSNFSNILTSGDFEGKKRKADSSRCNHIRDIGIAFERFLTNSKIKKTFFN